LKIKGLSKKLKQYIREDNLLYFFHIFFVAVITLNLFELSVENCSYRT